MGLTLFLIIQIISVAVCFFATRSTFRYLSKHQVVPQQRYTLFQIVRVRHIGLGYLASVILVCLYAFAYGLFISVS